MSREDKYPEIAKLNSLPQTHLSEIVFFLDFLKTNGYFIAQNKTAGPYVVTESVDKKAEEWICEFHGVDYKKLLQERKQMQQEELERVNNEEEEAS